GACKPERVPRYLQMIDDSAQDALGYIRRYLETQARRGDGSDRGAEGARAALDEVLSWLRDRYELQLESRGMRLHCDLPAAGAMVAMDPLVLRQVTENLVSNAMKYAADGGVLDLSARRGAPDYWQIWAEDRGPGIPERRRRELFKPFV